MLIGIRGVSGVKEKRKEQLDGNTLKTDYKDQRKGSFEEGVVDFGHRKKKLLNLL